MHLYILQYIDAAASIHGLFLKIFNGELKAGRYHPNMIICMTWCFLPTSDLHKLNFQIPEEDIINLTTKHQAWRNDLKVGDMVDVRLFADITKPNCDGWLQGKIEEVEEDNLNVIFPKASSIFDRTINRWSYDLAPFESMTKEDYEWKATLETSTEEVVVDCHDKLKWEEATLVGKKVTSSDMNRPYAEV